MGRTSLLIAAALLGGILYAASELLYKLLRKIILWVYSKWY